MKHHRIDTNGITLHVVEAGCGPAVLFAHGFPDTWRGWRRQMEAVASAGYRAVSLDMRGYGESSTPQDAGLYTVFYSVGDLVGVLDALQIKNATLVGHDFGAAISWNAAMMRPDRFTAVFGMSVPPMAPGGKSFLERLHDAGKDTFYMFRQMRPEADVEWADAARTLPSAFWWTSASPPEEQRWDPLDPDRGLLRPAPVAVPAWADPEDFRAAIADFQRNGFHGPLNYYRAIQPFYDMAGAFAGAKVERPSFFLIGKADGLASFRKITEEDLRAPLPALRGFVELDDVGHWPQLEATDAVNSALLGFLTQSY